MKVRCKFYVTSIAHNHVHQYPGTELASCVNVTLQPIWEENGPNRKWSKMTPNGQIQMTITNPEASDIFELGKVYTVDFARAE